jgi:hypothetical protein
MERKFDLDERLINFAVAIINISEKLPKTFCRKSYYGTTLVKSTETAKKNNTVK